VSKKVSSYSLILTLIAFILVLPLLIYFNRTTTLISVPNINKAPNAAQVDVIIDGKININTADAKVLSMLNGVGIETAQRIIEYRNDHGAFHSLDELLDVKGIGNVKLNKLRNYITVGG